MTDPFAIIGVASSIISFIDFGVKITKLFHDCRNGTLPEVDELDQMVRETQTRCTEIKQKSASGSRKSSEDEKYIMSQVTQCEQLALSLCKILQTLKAKDGTWIERSRITWKTFRKRPALEVLQHRLEEMRHALEDLDWKLRANVNQALQHEHNSAILSELRALRALRYQLNINCGDTLEILQTEILQLTEPSDANKEAEQRVLLKDRLTSLEESGSRQRQQLKLIKSLYFPEITRRWSNIKDSEHRTNTWLFNQHTTNFLNWLKSGDGIYWISGKAGSGKSTLMKFASEHRRTRDALEQWAQSAHVYSPSFYFWSQGFEMQKSQLGLLQSILYQILRQTPGIATEVCEDHLSHEGWSVDEVKATLRRVLERKNLPAKFCFFIDGLDEYGGEEETLIHILSFFTHNSNVKLCVSSRPRTVLDRAFLYYRHTLVIQNYTAEDMRTYVREELQKNDNFRILLENSGPECSNIITDIAEGAQGVWLWVFFVTRDLVHAVNRNEGIATLQDIIRDFPPHLEAYFNRIIENIKPVYKEEMAKILLTTIEQVQPLPLFVFSLLEKERIDPDYAIKAQISPLLPKSVELVDEPWKARIQNRCGDLVTVEDKDHPIYLMHPVDYLHRTVGDFLRDCYYGRLKELAPGFNAHVSLCKMMLFLLKGLPACNRRDKRSITTMIGITDELLYYAHEAEKNNQQTAVPNLINLLDEVDKVNCRHNQSIGNHWTHLRDSPTTRGNDEYREGGKYDFLALAIQARLVKYVDAKLQSDSGRMRKNGRPLLDYALRPRRVTPISIKYHSQRDDPSVDVDMVRLLLQNGADPNQKVHLNDGRTVWALFLSSCYESVQAGEVLPHASLKDAWYQASELLISHGARSVCWFDDNPKSLTVPRMLHEIFGEDEARRLKQKLAENLPLRRAKSSYFEWVFGGYK